ncbi:MAG: hypothetical protein EZS28_048792, partial [Streblomastix strix]
MESFLIQSRQFEDKSQTLDILNKVCENVSILIDENFEAIDFCFRTNLVQELIQILNDDIKFEDVTFNHINALKCFGVFGTIAQRKKLSDLGVSRAIVKYLKSQDEKVTEFTATVLAKCIFNEWTTAEDETTCIDQPLYDFHPFPHYDNLGQDGVIDALFEDGFLNGRNGKTKQLSAECLAYIYSSKTLPEQLRVKLISHLKEINDEEIKKDNFIEQLIRKAGLLKISKSCRDKDTYDSINNLIEAHKPELFQYNSELENDNIILSYSKPSNQFSTNSRWTKSDFKIEKKLEGYEFSTMY